VSNTKELGKLLYTEYLYPLEIAAVILLVAIIAAIALTLRQRKDSKHDEPGRAGEGAARDRLRSSRCRRRMAAPPRSRSPGAAANKETKA
jgi:NADH-quinone oxidoreductase subunit J